MKTWVATVRIEEKDNYNNTWPELEFQVKVRAKTYGEASIAANKYILNHQFRCIGPIEELNE